MAAFRGPRIVTDGLILYLDAANSKSYPGSGTTWTDMSGNGNDGALLNGVLYDAGGYFSFDGSNDRVSVADNSSLDIIGDKSLSCWVYMGADSNGCAIAGKMSSSLNGMGLGYGWNSNGFMALAWNSTNNPFIAKDISRDVTKWNFVSGVQSGTTRSVYVWDEFGLRTASHIGGTHTWNNNLDFSLGRTSDGASGAPGNTRISQVFIYNRAITPQEIEINFDALRSRFGV